MFPCVASCVEKKWKEKRIVENIQVNLCIEGIAHEYFMRACIIQFEQKDRFAFKEQRNNIRKKRKYNISFCVLLNW